MKQEREFFDPTSLPWRPAAGYPAGVWEQVLAGGEDEGVTTRFLRFEDEVEIHMLVREKKSKSLSYLFRFRKLNASPVIEVARGGLTVVCVTHEAKGKMAAITIPEYLAQKIEVAPTELLV